MDDGFANLVSPKDLRRKLEHDRARIAADPNDTFAAFDFFVTAEHLLDWTLPDAPEVSMRKAREQRRAEEPLLAIASHVASGAKHFRVTAKHHTRVTHADTHEGSVDSNAFSPSAFSPSAFAMPGLHIRLDDGSVLHVSELADRLLEYWTGRIGQEAHGPVARAHNDACC